MTLPQRSHPLSQTPRLSVASVAQKPTTHQLIHDKIVKWLKEEASQDVGQIDYDASLLEFGIDSLGVATIARELERETRKTLNPEEFFELETINELADYLDSLRPAPEPTTRQDAVASPHAAQEAEAVAEEARTRSTSPIDYYERMNRRVRLLKEQGQYFFEPEVSEHDGAWIVVRGKRMLMLGSYEYLGLLGHPRLDEAAAQAVEKFGTGHHGVRLLAGTTPYHKLLESKLATFMKAEDAIVYGSGYVTNLTTIAALVGRGDLIIGDQWNHASIFDGCRMSGADLLTYAHNDMGSLAEMLDQANGRRTLVVVDAVFSMDGDIVDLPAVIELCRKHNALLMVDEAHSLGVLGETGRGVQEHFDLDPSDIDIKMGTLSKALAGSGGFIAAREEIITFLRHHARGYIFSGSVPVSQVATAVAALEVLEETPEMIQRLRKNCDRYCDGLRELGFDTGVTKTPIVPIMTRTEAATLEMTQRCRQDGLMVVPVSFPAVPFDAPRLRTCMSAAHTNDEIDFALQVLGKAGRATGLIG
jgi:glycine C-acetyltransferase